MPFKDENERIGDIANAIAMIEKFTYGMDFDQFRADPKTVAAVERMLLIISEAAIRLGAAAEVNYPGVAWRDIRGMGNWLRHQYDRVELPVIWRTVEVDLPPLKRVVFAALGW